MTPEANRSKKDFVAVIESVHPPTLQDARNAWVRIKDLAIQSPLLELNQRPSANPVYLKLESLQPVGAYKARSAGNVISSLPSDRLAKGVFTASSGNMGIAVAWIARRLNMPASVVVPETAPDGKLAKLKALGAKIIRVPYDDWWTVIETHRFDGLEAEFIDGSTSSDAMAGSATIGLELIDASPRIDTVFVPIGGGGLACGIAAVVKEHNPNIRIIAVEVESSTPLTDALRAGRPVAGQQLPCFVTGIGARTILPHMWPLLRDLIDGTVIVSLKETADAVRILFMDNCVVAEGAGAASVAAAMSGKISAENAVAIVSGGNIDKSHMIDILHGQVPG